MSFPRIDQKILWKKDSDSLCPKCSSHMDIYTDINQCSKCEYWEGHTHAYHRLRKEGKLG